MNVYLCNALGFFVQLFPCMLLVFLPFSEQSLCFRKKYICAGVIVAAAALSGLFPAVMRGALRWNVAAAANIYMLITILLTLAAELWLVREAAIKKLLVILAVLFYGVAQYWLVNILSGAVADVLPLSLERASWAVYSVCGLTMYAVTTALLMPLMMIFVIRPMGEYLQEMETQGARQEIWILIASTVFFLVLVMTVDIRYYRQGNRLYLRELPLFLIVMLDQLAIYWLIFRESVRRKRDNEHQRALEIQQLQYEKIAGDMENTHRQSHDLRHHYTALREMLRHGRLQEMEDYLSQVLDDAAKRMNEVYCKDMAVNGLLQYYAGLARDEDIRCDIRAECDRAAVDAVDLTVLLGNAMENAINACRRYPAGRWISVHIGTVQGSLAIEISNACKGVRMNGRVQTEDGFLPAGSFLSGRAGGGYGLRSIDRTARKYGGSAYFRYNAEKEMFTSRIRLNMRTDL